MVSNSANDEAKYRAPKTPPSYIRYLFVSSESWWSNIRMETTQHARSTPLPHFIHRITRLSVIPPMQHVEVAHLLLIRNILRPSTRRHVEMRKRSRTRAQGLLVWPVVSGVPPVLQTAPKMHDRVRSGPRDVDASEVPIGSPIHGTQESDPALGKCEQDIDDVPRRREAQQGRVELASNQTPGLLIRPFELL